MATTKKETKKIVPAKKSAVVKASATKSVSKPTKAVPAKKVVKATAKKTTKK
jgi:hypothetical protein